MYRLRLGGDWGAFDPRYGYYLIDRDAADARVLDWREIGADASILKNRGYRHRSRPFFEFLGEEWKRAFLINECFYESEQSWVRAGRPVECVFADPKHAAETRFHEMNFRLPKGMTIERFWDNSAKMFYVPAGEHTQKEERFLSSGRVYRVTETMLDGNWPKFDPNHKKAAPYLARVPPDEGYNNRVSGGRTIGQAWGRLVYNPNLRDPEFLSVLTPESNLAHTREAPYLRLPGGNRSGSATFDFYSPYVLVDGALEGELSGAPEAVRIEIRTLRAKPLDRGEPDVWPHWQTLSKGPGKFQAALGRERFNGSDVSIHGVYRFQLRISAERSGAGEPAAGLKALKFTAYFENGIMTIPRIFQGRNTIRFKVADSSAVRDPIRVVYHYQTPAGVKSHARTLQPPDFHGNEAVYVIEAPDLIRCNSLAITY